MSKKIKRDESGSPILPGSKTFGTVVRPQGGRRNPRSYMLREKALNKFIRLIGHRDVFHEPCKQEQTYLNFQKAFAEQPKIVQFAYYRGKLTDLQTELKDLEKSNNKQKISLLRPLLLKEIETTTNEMRILYEEIKMAPRRISITDSEEK